MKETIRRNGPSNIDSFRAQLVNRGGDNQVFLKTEEAAFAGMWVQTAHDETR